MSSAPADQPTEAGTGLPAALWLAWGLYWVFTGALALSLVGLLLAVAGYFHPLWLVIVGLPTMIGLGLWGWSPFRRAAADRISGGPLPVIAVVLVIAGSAIGAGTYSAEHLLTNRDPGVYLTTGRWLADEGTLLVDGAVGGFAGVDGVDAAALGFYDTRDDGTVDPQFLHTLPVWSAVAQWLGGDQAMFRTNAAIVGMALAALWLFAATITRPWFAVLATAAAAVSLVTVHFARDLYTEPLMLFYVFAALAFLSFAAAAQHRGLAIIAGLMTGAVAMVRIDGWLVVISIVAYLAVAKWSGKQAGSTGTIKTFVDPALLGILVTGSVGLLDAAVRSRPYLIAHRSEIVMMFGLLVAIIAIETIALRRPEPFSRVAAWYAAHRQTFAWVVPMVIVVAAAMLFFVRPLVQEVHQGTANIWTEWVQQYEGAPVDGTRTYAEASMRWLSWYLGIFGLAVGVAGLAWAWRRSILGLRGLWPFLMVMSLTTALYVLRPGITPDQLWAMRRFLPVVIPGLIVAGVLTAQWGSDRVSLPPLRWAALAGATLVLVIVPAWFTWPLRTSTSYVGMAAALEQVCEVAPEGSAVLMASQTHSDTYQAVVRSFCRVPVAGIDLAVLHPLCVIASSNEAWKAEGVNLIVGYGDEFDLEPDVRVESSYVIPELTVTRRPAMPIAFSFAINLADADRFDQSSCPP